MVSTPTLILAEKPYVAKDIANALGITPVGKDFYTDGTITITWCNGHLLELCPPEYYNEAWATWDVKNLPLAPTDMKFEYRVKDQDAQSRLDVIVSLAKKTSIIVNACDAAREGEYIFTLVMDYIRPLIPTMPITERMWMNTTTKEGLLEAWHDKKPGDLPQYTSLARAARARDQADWLLGMNGTEAATLALPAAKVHRTGGVPVQQSWSVGRVQTAVLGEVTARDQAIRKFNSQPYSSLYLNFNGGKSSYQGRLLVPEGFARLGQYTMLFADEGQAGAAERLIQTKIPSSRVWGVVEKVFRQRHFPPRLFSLVSIQRHCAIALGWTAQRTLDALQTAYAFEKTISYPRTDSDALPSDFALRAQELYEIIAAYISKEAPNFAVMAPYPPNSMVDPVRIFDNRKVRDHYAIIPTGVIPASDEKEAHDVRDALLIWRIIAKRYLLAFSPPAAMQEVERMTDTELELSFAFRGHEPGYKLKLIGLTKAQWLTDPGWYSVAQALKHSVPDKIPPTDPFPTAVTSAKLEKVELYNGYTSAPEPHTEESILGTMEHEKLGTSATRASILELLMERGYVERHAARPPVLRSTPRGRYLIEALEVAQLGYLTQPSVTANWELELEKMIQGDPEALSIEKFIAQVFIRVTELVALLRKPPIPAIDVVCPKSGLPVLERAEFYEFPGYPSVICAKQLHGRVMTAREYRDVLSTSNGAGPFKGFLAKKGTTYASKLIYNQKKTDYLPSL